MKNLFRQPFSPSARFLVLMWSGFGFGLLMTQLDLAARHVDLFVEAMDFTHRPAYFIAGLIHEIIRFTGDLSGSRLELAGPNPTSALNGLTIDLGALKYIRYGIVAEWTLFGALTGIACNVWGLSRRPKSKFFQKWGAER